MSDEGETSPIRVYCRFRDDQHLYASDISQSQKDHIEQFPTSFNVETHQVSIYPSQVTRKAIQFEFTGLIPPHMTQEQTFQMIAKDNIALVLNGYNCSIIAYGQTGSGKTHLIFGREGDTNPTQMGLLPRTVAYIIHRIKTAANVKEASITLSCLEIFQEKLRDLIAPQTSPQLKIRMSANGEMFIENITQQYIANSGDALKMIEVMKLHRSKLSKNSIFSSHRTHCITILSVKQLMADGSSLRGKLYFCDLAGAEFAGKQAVSHHSTNNSLSMMKESHMNINRSLTALRVIVHSVASRKKRVPYSDSALTSLLRESFGGSFKTTIIITCSMHILNREETITSLRFGRRCALIENHVNYNRELSRPEMKELVSKQTVEITNLTSQIRRLQQMNLRRNSSSNSIQIDGKENVNEVQSSISTEKDEETMDTILKMQQDITDLTLELKEKQEKYEKVFIELKNDEQIHIQQLSELQADIIGTQEKCQDMESKYDDTNNKYNTINVAFKNLDVKCDEQKIEIQSLLVEISNVTIDNDNYQIEIEQLSHHNKEAKVTSEKIIEQLHTLESQIALQQQEFEALERKNAVEEDKKEEQPSSSAPVIVITPSVDDDQMDDVDYDDVPRSSVIIHSLISLNTENSNENKPRTLSPKFADGGKRQSTLMVRQSHHKLKQSLYTLQELLSTHEHNTLSFSPRFSTIKETKENAERLIKQYNNVMTQYQGLQKNFNQTQKDLSSKDDQIKQLDKEKSEILDENEQLRYQMERMKLEFQQRQQDLEQSLDQKSIQQQNLYLKNMFATLASASTDVTPNSSPLPNKFLSAESAANKFNSTPYSADVLSIINMLHSQNFSLSNNNNLSVNFPSLLENFNNGGNSPDISGQQTLVNMLRTTNHNSNNNTVSLPTVPEKTKQDEWRDGLRHRFELIDTDHDGYVTLDDFVTFTKSKNPKASTDQILKIFQSMDALGNGKINFSEFERSFRKFALRNMAIKRLEAAGTRNALSVPFDERESFTKLGSKGRLHMIQVWYDDVIYGFRCTWIRRSSSSSSKTKQVIGESHLKVDGAKSDVFMLKENEYLTCLTIWVKSGKVHGITLETSEGRWHEFGGGMGTPILLQPPEKHAIHAFYGGLDECLHYLGAYALPFKDKKKESRKHKKSKKSDVSISIGDGKKRRSSSKSNKLSLKLHGSSSSSTVNTNVVNVESKNDESEVVVSSNETVSVEDVVEIVDNSVKGKKENEDGKRKSGKRSRFKKLWGKS